MYAIELNERITTFDCPDSGKKSMTVWGFVFKDESAHAVYYAGLMTGHEQPSVRLTVSIGGWGVEHGDEQSVSGHKHSGEGKSGSIHERLDGVLQPRTTGQDSWQNASGLGCAESLNNRRDRPLQRCSVALRWIEWGCSADHRLISRHLPETPYRQACGGTAPPRSVALFRKPRFGVS